MLNTWLFQISAACSRSFCLKPNWICAGLERGLRGSAEFPFPFQSFAVWNGWHECSAPLRVRLVDSIPALRTLPCNFTASSLKVTQTNAWSMCGVQWGWTTLKKVGVCLETTCSGDQFNKGTTFI